MAKKSLAQLKADAKREGWADMIRTPNDERAIMAGYRFNRRRADYVCEFFETFLRHTRNVGVDAAGCAVVSAGEPFRLLPWQRDYVIGPLYGWEKPNGLRRFGQAYVSVAKKNGKSTLTSGLVLYHLLADGELSPEVYAAACEREQASIIYRHAAGMVQLSRPLMKALDVLDSQKVIRSVKGGFFKALSAESGSKEGLDWSCLIFDELHRQKTDDLWNTLKFGGRARRQPLLVVITTAGDNQGGICYQLYRYAQNVMSGDVEDLHFYGYVAEAPADCALDDPDAIRAANPSVGVTLDLDSLMNEAQAAKANSRDESTFRRYTLNQWTNVAGGWLSMDDWDACGGVEVDWDRLRGQEVYVGVDLSSKLDMTCVVAVAPHGDGYAVRPTFFCPRERAGEMARKGIMSYSGWAQRGWLQLTEGNVVDYNAVLKEVFRIADEYEVVSVAVDPWNAGDIMNRMTDHGLQVVEIPQTVKRLSDPAKWFEALVVDKRIYHNQHPILRWNAGNVCVRVDTNDNILPQKPVKGGPDLIDGIAATVNAISEIKRVELERLQGAMNVDAFLAKYGGLAVVE